MFSIFRSKIFTVLASAALLWLTISYIKGQKVGEDVTQQVRDLEAKIEKVKEDNQYLAKVISYFKIPSFLEKEARQKLNYKNPDENVAFVYLADDKTASASSDSNSSDPFYKKLWGFLQGLID